VAGEKHPLPHYFPLSKIIYKHNIISLEAGLDFGGSGIYCGCVGGFPD
jgi:hypothetical protein